MTFSHRRSSCRPAARRLILPGSLIVLSLHGCSSLTHFVGGDKVDYRNGTIATQTASLEVPPDLTQLSRDSRYQQPGGVVNATTFQGAGPASGAAAAPAAPASAAPVVASSNSDVHIERAGNERWLATKESPDALWPQLQAFWRDNGMTLVVDDAKVGVMETEWAENRAKLPQDILRSTLGRVLDPLYSTGERDKFRTRVERTASGGSEIYVSHRGMEEIYSTADKSSTAWQPRKPDPELEAVMLQRLMVRLGVQQPAAETAVAVTSETPAGPTRARIVEGQAAATLQVDDGFDRAWRRVGLALDRGGFTVEDRDRTQGVYFVRYVDPKYAGREEPNFFQRLFSFGKKDVGGPKRYRVHVQVEPGPATGVGAHSAVTVLDSEGKAENGDPGKRIVALLFDELK